MQPEPGGQVSQSRKLLILVIAVIVALVIAITASYGVVVSQNPKPTVPGAATNYGPNSA